MMSVIANLYFKSCRSSRLSIRSDYSNVHCMPIRVQVSLSVCSVVSHVGNVQKAAINVRISIQQ